ncbi:MAG: hypothetical protein IH598_05520 [Bacteroidales bacterium]|nr:hypothetical protein [Bacteroidales bacterium]
MPTIYFEEEQRFTQGWIFLLLIVPVTVIVWGVIQQVIMGIQFGNNPAPDWVLILILAFMMLLAAFPFILKLKTLINKEGISYRFFPFHRSFKTITWDMVDKVYVRKYSPIGEFGGWGFRYGKNGKALNTSGNKGLQIEFRNGTKLLIGTQRPDELQKTLYQLGVSSISGFSG